ncbi:MAG: hypothetical protein AABX99_03645 [Nanoarchaeota archaeon]
MEQTRLSINKIKCDSSEYHEIEVKFLKERFLQKKPIPSPWINKKNEVVAFHSSYFVSKELGHKKMLVVPQQ